MCKLNSLVSVIVPVYNVADYLDVCITSLVNQTHKELEIVLVDDGSTDGSSDVCDKWKHVDNRIVVLHKPNGGLSSARNAGLDVAKGEFVSFIDSDDYVDAFFIERLICKMLKDHRIGIASAMLYSVEEDCVKKYRPEWTVTKECYINPKDFAFYFLSARKNFIICSKLFRAPLLSNLRFRVGKLNEDSLFIFDLSQIIEEGEWLTIEIPYRGYYYRQRISSISHNEVKPLEVSALENFNMMRDYYESKGDKRMIKQLSFMYNRLLLALNYKVLKNRELKEVNFDKYQKKLSDISLTSFLVSNFNIKDIAKFLILKYGISFIKQ